VPRCFIQKELIPNKLAWVMLRVRAATFQLTVEIRTTNSGLQGANTT